MRGEGCGVQGGVSGRLGSGPGVCGEEIDGCRSGGGMSECRGGCCGGNPGGWVRWGGCVGWQVEDSAGGWVKSECEQRAHGNTGRWMTRSDLEEKEWPSR